MKFLFLFLSFLILYGCNEQEKSDSKKEYSNNEVYLSDSSVTKINEILGPFEINDKKWKFISAKFIKPNLHPIYYNDTNTSEYVFLELQDAKNDILVVGVNYSLCGIEIVYPFNEYYYIDMGTIYPIYSTFLKTETKRESINCLENDTIKVRSMSYDWRTKGKWNIDSVINPIESKLALKKNDTTLITRYHIATSSDTFDFKLNSDYFYVTSGEQMEYYKRIIVNFQNMVWQYELDGHIPMTIYFTKVTEK